MNTNAELKMVCPETDWRKVEEERRTDAMAAAHGLNAVEFEVQVFSLAGKMLDGYRGGYWDIYEVRDELGTAVFMVMPDPGMQRVTSPSGSSYMLSAVDAGLVLCVFANNWLASLYARRDTKMVERFCDQYERLYAFARRRPAVQQILALLD